MSGRFGMWCRDRARRELEQLEGFEAWLEEYGEKHDLLFVHRDTIRSNDITDSRSNECARAVKWLQDEMNWTRDQLKVFERDVA